MEVTYTIHEWVAAVLISLTLRQGLGDKFLRENGLSYEPDPVVICNGARYSLPGKVFGSDDNIRLSYACSQESMGPLGRFFASL